MSEYELSAHDFRIIDRALSALQRTADWPQSPDDYNRANDLQLKFERAHTGWLEIDWERP